LHFRADVGAGDYISSPMQRSFLSGAMLSLRAAVCRFVLRGFPADRERTNASECNVRLIWISAEPSAGERQRSIAGRHVLPGEMDRPASANIIATGVAPVIATLRIRDLAETRRTQRQRFSMLPHQRARTLIDRAMKRVVE